MKKSMEKTVTLQYRDLMNRYRMTQLTGQELYDQYGVKRDEVLFSEEAQFDDGHVMELSMVAGEDNEYPDYRIQLISESGNVVADVSEDYDRGTLLGAFTAEDEDNHTVYTVHVGMTRCAIPIRYTDSEEVVSNVYCDSNWLTKHFEDNDENLLCFLDEYTSEDSVNLISEAILANAVAFCYAEETDCPFDFISNEEWKYKAFADVISGWLNKEHPEASKALDCFLNL